MSETTIATVSRTFSGTFAGYKASDKFTITAKAHRLGCNQHPHFSVTAEVRSPGARNIEAGGCMHDEILKAWPAIKPIVDLHLSNSDDGQPIHAEANGWYWMAGALGGAGEEYHGGNSKQNFPITPPKDKPWCNTEHRLPTPDECLPILADHLRITVEQARDLREKCKAAITREPGTVGYKRACLDAREIFAAFVREQAERWQAEAEAGLALIRELSGEREMANA